MCGICGVLKLKGFKTKNEKRVWQLFTSLLVKTQSRGRDATGVAAVIKDQLRVVKADVQASDFVESEDYKVFSKMFKDTRIVIAHTRHKTQGSEKDMGNNHPIFLKKGLAMTHNGVITNDDDIFKHEDIERDAEVDSEAILRLYDKYNADLDELGKRIGGSYAVAVIREDAPTKIQLFRHTNPLDMVYIPELDVIFYASTINLLKDALKETALKVFKKESFGDMFTYEMSNNQSLVLDVDSPDDMEITSFDPPFRISHYDQEDEVESVPCVRYNTGRCNSSRHSFSHEEFDGNNVIEDLIRDNGEVKFTVSTYILENLEEKINEWKNIVASQELSIFTDKVSVALKPSKNVSKSGKKIVKAIKKWITADGAKLQTKIMEAFEVLEDENPPIYTAGEDAKNRLAWNGLMGGA